MSKLNVALIETSSTGAGLYLFEAALKNNIQVYFICRNFDKYKKIGIEKYLDKIEVIIADTTHKEAIEEALDKIISLNGIVCYSDKYIEAVAHVAKKRQLTFTSLEAIITCRNKFETWNFCVKNAIQVPQSVLLDVGHLESLNTIKFPMVIKTNDGTGSQNVCLCHNRNELHKHIDDIKVHAGPTVPILCQEYVMGPLVSVESIVFNNEITLLGITDRILGMAPYFVEKGYSFPITLGSVIEKQLFETTKKFLTNLNPGFGVFHIEYILTKDGPVLIEANPRIPGGMLSPVISASLGFNLHEELINIALNRQPTISRAPTKSLTMEIIYPPNEGLVAGLSNLQIAQDFPGIEAIKIHAKNGDYVHKPSSYLSEQIAHVLTSGATTELSKSYCAAAISTIAFSIVGV